jgi:filamentous hemagglutinin family protein
MNKKSSRQLLSGSLISFRRRAMAALMIALMVSPGSAFSLPTGPQVINGTATFSQNGSGLTITNSKGAIINWNSFSIGSGEITRFIQSSATSSVLNRVTGGNASAIYGTLQSNGRVFLINPSGILFGPNAVVNVNGFVASTLNISNDDFKAGRMKFNAGTQAGKIENQGTITTPSGGSVYLIAPNIENSGVITAPNGDIILAAGHQVELADSSTPGLTMVVSAPDDQVVNLNRIIADSGRIGIYGGIISQKGVISADSATAGKGGRIFLRAQNAITLDTGSKTTANGARGGDITVQSKEGDTLVSGTVEATGSNGKGGTVRLLGQNVGLIDSATVDASGNTGGGTVLVGGDYQGKNPLIQNAQAVYVGKDTVIMADAIKRGNGGKVIVWADDVTRAYGSISARGGSSSGKGGFVEISGKNYLDYSGLTDLRAPHGKVGTLLLDPSDITIDNSASDTLGGGTLSGGYFQDATSPATLTWNTINTQLGLGGLEIRTSGSGGNGDININAGTTLTNSNYLTLLANRDINFNGANVTASGDINLIAGWNNTGLAVTPGVGNITFNPGSSLSTSGSVFVNAGGNLTLQAGSAPASFSSARIWSHGNQTFNIGGNVSLFGGNGGNDNRAEIVTDGSQSFTIGGNLLLQAGNAGYNNSVWIQAAGNQSFTIGGNLTLLGGGSTGSYNNNAGISHDYARNVDGTPIGDVSGNQTFTFTNNATLAMTGGAGDGMAGYSDSDCGPACSGYVSNNGASITNYGGNQTFDFKGGGAINLTGGTVGNGNDAYIGNEAGTQQKIYSSQGNNPTITLLGGNSGGVVIAGTIDSVNPTKDYSIDNGAGISSDGTQEIHATDISMTGGAGADTKAGVYLGAPVTTINATSLAMTGGDGVVGSTIDPAGNPYHNPFVLASPAAIGNEKDGNITLNIASGGITVNGGSLDLYGGSPVMIGSLSGTPTINISSVGNISLLGAAKSVLIGTLLGTGSTINLTHSGTGIMNLGNAAIGNGSGTVNLKALNGSIVQDLDGWINAGTLNMNAQNIFIEGHTHSTQNTQIIASSLMTVTGGGSAAGRVVADGDLTVSSDTLIIGNDDYTALRGTNIKVNAETLVMKTGGILASNNVDINAGSIVADNISWIDAGNNVTATVAGDFRLNNGSMLTARNDVFITLSGSTSTLYINETADMSPSYILTGMPTTTHLNFTTRSSGGVVIDGVDTITSVANGSGIFAGSRSTPATLDSGLVITYSSSTTPNTVLQTTTQIANTIYNSLINTPTSPVEQNTGGMLAALLPPTDTPAGSGSGSDSSGSSDEGKTGNGKDKGKDNNGNGEQNSKGDKADGKPKKQFCN